MALPAVLGAAKLVSSVSSIGSAAKSAASSVGNTAGKAGDAVQNMSQAAQGQITQALGSAPKAMDAANMTKHMISVHPGTAPGNGPTINVGGHRMGDIG
jgi:hypothetical protein